MLSLYVSIINWSLIKGFAIKVAKRILLVDDDVNTVLAMSRLLTRAGFDTTLATTKTAALKHCAEKRFDILVADLRLPDGDGLDLLKEISAMYPIRGIVCSGMDEQERDRCLAGGFAAYFSKPIPFEQLLASLTEPTPEPFILVPCRKCAPV